MAIDWNKPVETESGYAVTVLCTNRPDCVGYSHKPVVAYVDDTGHLIEAESDGSWMLRGEVQRLRNVCPKPVKREGWMFVGKTEAAIRMNTYVYASEDIARERHPGGCHGYQLIRIEWEEVP